MQSSPSPENQPSRPSEAEDSGLAPMSASNTPRPAQKQSELGSPQREAVSKGSSIKRRALNKGPSRGSRPTTSRIAKPASPRPDKGSMVERFAIPTASKHKPLPPDASIDELLKLYLANVSPPEDLTNEVFSMLGITAPDGAEPTRHHWKLYLVEKLHHLVDVPDKGLKSEAGNLYVWNGSHWVNLVPARTRKFLLNFAERVGIPKCPTICVEFIRAAVNQMLHRFENLPKPPMGTGVLVNCQNVTLEISGATRTLRTHSKEDHLLYVLRYPYIPEAKCKGFQKFLDRVLPDKECQAVLAEFFAWCFLRNLKLEKVLVLLGEGENGKSVLFDVMMALFGSANVSNVSIKELAKKENRLLLAGKLLNYASELSARIDSPTFKQLASGEPIEARKLYHDTVIISDYARLAFNANRLPSGIEHSKGMLRRFLILPFNTTITSEEKNPNLAREIIETELPGILNWVLEGLQRVVANKGFSPCSASENVLAEYSREVDSVKSFVRDMVIVADRAQTPKATVYRRYRDYCRETGMCPETKVGFCKRLRSQHKVRDGKTDRVRFWRLKLKASWDERDVAAPASPEPTVAASDPCPGGAALGHSEPEALATV